MIDNEFLCSLNIGIDPGWLEELLERRTTLTLDYVRRTRNTNTRAAAEASDTSMAGVPPRCTFPPRPVEWRRPENKYGGVRLGGGPWQLRGPSPLSSQTRTNRPNAKVR